MICVFSSHILSCTFPKAIILNKKVLKISIYFLKYINQKYMEIDLGKLEPLNIPKLTLTFNYLFRNTDLMS